MNHVHTDTVETLCRATTTPRLVRVPQLRFLYLGGHGDPNTSPESASAVQALYAMSYGAKLAIEKVRRTLGGGAGLRRAGAHKRPEIYLGNPRRAAPEKLRTIIRQSYAG